MFGGSHVSVKDRMSIELSDMNSFRRAGLLYESVIEEAERVLRWTRLRSEEIMQGPGLSSTSPARIRSKRRM